MKEKSWEEDVPGGKNSVAVPQVNAIAVYINWKGEIVIHQRSSLGEDDSLVVFPAAHARALADAILSKIEK